MTEKQQRYYPFSLSCDRPDNIKPTNHYKDF